MGTGTQNLRDVLSLAKLLRRVAERHIHDRFYDQFLSTASELEERANVFARTNQPFAADLEREVVLHAPINLVI